MKTLIPYFTIPGSCEEALSFYEACFNGKTTFMQRYEETDYDISAQFQQKIAHAEFKADDFSFYVSDGFENAEVNKGNNVGMTINFDDETEQRMVFERLKQDGEVTLGFSITSIETQLVSLIDKYGIHWYLNYTI